MATIEAVAVDSFRKGERPDSDASNDAVPTETVAVNLFDGTHTRTFPDYQWFTYGSTSPSVFAVAAATPTVSEGTSDARPTGTTPVTFTVTRTGDTSQAATVGWRVLTPGSTVNGLDLQDPSMLGGTREIAFAPGQSSAQVSIAVLRDTMPEPDEQLIVRLFQPSEGSLDSNAFSAAVTVVNDDGAFTYENVSNWAIAKALQESDPDVLTLYDVLEAARRHVNAERDIDSTDLTFRDAERYILGVNTGATRDAELIRVVGIGAPFYEGLKQLARWAGVEELMRADPTKQNSDPGGLAPVYRGILDGMRLRDDLERQRREIHQRDQRPRQEQEVLRPLSGILGESSYPVRLVQAPQVPIDRVSRLVWNKLPSQPLVLGAGNDIVISASATPTGLTALATARAAAGGSRVNGGAGSDLVIADVGPDLLGGGPGADLLVAGLDRDVVDGGGGNDVLVPGPGADIVATGPGADIVVGTAAEFAGDAVLDLSPRDLLRVDGHMLRPQDVLFANGGLRIDGNGDGVHETVVRLVGRFRPDRFAVSAVSGASVIRYLGP